MSPREIVIHNLETIGQAGVIRNEPLGRGRGRRLRREDLESRFPGLIDSVLGTASQLKAPQGA